MADFTDTYELIADTSGIAKAAQDLERLEAESRQAGGAVYAFAATTNRAEHEVMDFAGACIAEAKAMEQVAVTGGRAATATASFHAGATSASGSTRNWGLAINALAQGAEDMQYSVGGAMNNLSQFAVLMGAGGLVVAGVTIAGVAINQLVKHWDDLTGMLGSPAIRTAAKEMEELGKKTSLTNAEIMRMNELRGKEATRKAEEAGIKGLGEMRSPEDVAAGKAFSEAISASLGPGKTGADFIKAMTDAVMERNPGQERASAEAAVTERFGRAMAGSKDDIEFFRAYGGTGGAGSMPERFARELKGAEGADEWEKVVAEAENSGKAVSKRMRELEKVADKDWEEIVREAEETGRAAAKHLREARQRMEKMDEFDRIATRNAALASVRPDGSIPDNIPDENLTPEERARRNAERQARRTGLEGAMASAQREAMQAQIDHASAGDPRMRKFLMQMQARAAREGRGRGAMMARQVAVRAAGGQRAINERLNAEERFKKAVADFEQAANTLRVTI